MRISDQAIARRQAERPGLGELQARREIAVERTPPLTHRAAARCNCPECLALDRRHPREGEQLALYPAAEPRFATQERLL